MAISVTYYEMQGWPREWGNLNSAGAERLLMCDWDDRFTLADEITSHPDNIYPYLTTGTGAAVAIYAQDVYIQPFAAQTQAAVQATAEYETALVRVRYSSLAPGTADLVTEWIEPGMMTVRAPHRDLKWTTRGVDVAESERDPVQIPILVYNLRYHKAAAVSASIPPALGKINNAGVTTKLLGLTFSTHTLLYCAPRIVRTVAMNGVTLFDITHRMSFKSGGGSGWNYHWDSLANNGAGKWDTYEDINGNIVKDYDAAAFPI